MERGCRIAFDYGEVRIGVAFCDPDGILATPLTTLQSSSSKLKEEIANIVLEYQPIAIYVGDPLNLSGKSSQSSEKAAAFAQMLRETFEISVEMIDERLSTVIATGTLRQNGITGKAARATVDMAAAVAILEQGLALERGKNVE